MHGDDHSFREMAGWQAETLLHHIHAYCKLFLIEKRAKFDNGEDPLDPEQQQGGGWQNGGFPGGFPFGQGFQFKFHFP